MVNPETYLNTASCGLLSEASIKATNELYNAMLTNSSTAAEKVRFERIEGIRQTVAEFMKAPRNNLAFLPNFSFGINGIVHALKGTEKVLLYKNDYPSLLEPFKVNDFDITWIDSKDGFEINIEEIKAVLLKNKIDVLAMSHVQWLSGYKIDIIALGLFCKEHSITYIVDATQSLGAVNIAIEDMYVDVLIASNYKWMNAGFGTAVMYMSDRFLEKYTPVVAGFNSYIMKDGKMQYIPSIKSYEPGHTNMHGLLVLERAIKEKLSLGIDAIEKHNKKLIQLAIDSMSSGMRTRIIGRASADNRAFIVMCANEEVHAYLTEHGIVVTKRDGTIRISMHFNNTEADIENLVKRLNAYTGTRA
jgi:selenocysteine lyase/cysteine desulfurase